jgi:RNA polymerase sigma factor (sigma-70 family)
VTAGDPHEGFAGFYELAIPRVVFRARLITRDRELAWDVAQEAMTVMLEHWGERRRRTAEDNINYAGGIAANLAMSARRRLTAQARAVTRLDVAARRQAAEPFDTQVELMHDLSVALRGLSRRQRAVVVLSVFGMDAADVAHFLGIDVSTVRSHKQLIRRRLHLPAVIPVTGEGSRA